MPTLNEIFDKRKIILYQNESLDLDHYYQEPYQDENDEIKEMGKPFETDVSKKIRTLDLINEERTYSGFSYFMDGSRRTYKIGDMVLEGKKIYPVVVAQVRAGCTKRDQQKKLHTYGAVQKKNLLLLSDKMNEVDFQEIRQRILKTQMAKDIHLDIVKYHFEPNKDNVPVNAAIAKANSMMHDMEIDILGKMVNSGTLEPNHMLIVDGPLQFIRQDTGKPEFADMFYNVVGVSKSFDPIRQMRRRCPSARIIGTAELKGYELLFKGSRTGSYLTIEKQDDSMVPVAAWEVTTEDEQALDRYEGFPAFYYKVELTLPIKGIVSGKIRNRKCFVYIMHEDRPLGVPSDFYMDTRKEGYQDFGFDEKFLMDAIERSRK